MTSECQFGENWYPLRQDVNFEAHQKKRTISPTFFVSSDWAAAFFSHTYKPFYQHDAFETMIFLIFVLLLGPILSITFYGFARAWKSKKPFSSTPLCFLSVKKLMSHRKLKNFHLLQSLRCLFCILRTENGFESLRCCYSQSYEDRNTLWYLIEDTRLVFGTRFSQE